ncbi:MAG: AAA family ATPase [Actinomycetes bacterium]
MSGIFLAGSDDSWEESVRKAFGGAISGELRAWNESSEDDTSKTLGDIRSIEPLVVTVGPALGTESALKLCSEIDESFPEICVVLVSEPGDGVFERALRSGVRDVVSPLADASEIRETLDRAKETALKRRANLSSGPLNTETQSRVIAVVSPKGGAGKTAISTNLAVGLAQQLPGQVVVMDLDVQFGDVGHALRLLPERTLSDVVAQGSRLDATVVKACLTPHPSGLFVLSAPDTPAEADDVSPEQITKIIEILAKDFKYVILDTAAGLDEFTLTAMESATDLLLVCATDVASTRSMRKEIEAFDQIGLTTQRRHFALNRADARVGLEIRDIEGTIGMEVNVSIPSSRNVPLSMNQGTPILESSPRTPVARAYGELVNHFLAPPNDAPAFTTSTEAAVSRFRRKREVR